MDKILWSSQKPPMRYFWVPAGEDVFVGDYGIENNEGETFEVDLESLIPFEISGAEAEALMMQDLENMTKELGGLFKGLFQLGKRMLDDEILEADSEDDSDWDSDEDDSEDSSDEADLDAELDNILALFDEDSDEDSDADSDDEDIDAIISKLGSDLEGSLTELRDLIAKEVGNLGEELDTLGKEATEAIDEEPEAGQSILRELGSWLIRLADEQDADSEESSSEEPVIMPFPSVPEPEFTSETSEVVDNLTPTEASEEILQDRSTSESEHTAEKAVAEIQEDSEALEVDDATQQATETEHPSVELPSSSALKRMNKADLIELGTTLGLSLSSSAPKKDLLSAIETLR
jgi:hypothetical protein